MTKRIQSVGAMVALFLTVGINTAGAQDAGPGNFLKTPYRGVEASMDINAGRTGELALNFGAFDGNSLVGMRFSALDETDVIPCSLGVMYEYVAFRHSPKRFRPTAGGSVSHVFSCTDESRAIARRSPAVHGSGMVNAGLRMVVFRGRDVAASLKVLGFSERLFGQSKIADVNTRGLVLGVAVHAP
jgi:hypothetical protein